MARRLLLIAIMSGNCDTIRSRDNQSPITAALSQKRASSRYHVHRLHDSRSRDTHRQESHLLHVLIVATNRDTRALLHTSGSLRSTIEFTIGR